MKHAIVTLFHKPKIILPVFILVGVAVVASMYPRVGNAPVIAAVPVATTTDPSFADSSDTSTDLAFPKAGRISSVTAVVGKTVRKGEVLASLDAGDALGAVNQAKGALELAKAQYASLDVTYAATKKQQDVLVANAYQTLLSNNLTAVAHKKQNDGTTAAIDPSQIPTITGTYTCGKEGSYVITTYASGAQSGFSFLVAGLENGSGIVTNYTPEPIGSCGLFIQFPAGYFDTGFEWVIDIPNTKSSTYQTVKNAYDLAIATRDQVLQQIASNVGQNALGEANTAQAAVDAAQGAYEAALAAYQNDLITAPAAGLVTFVDPHLKVGQSVVANKTVISISTK